MVFFVMTMASVAHLDLPSSRPGVCVCVCLTLGFAGVRNSRQQFWAAAATRPTAGFLVEPSAWPSFHDAGELRHLPAAAGALPWHS